MNRIIYFSEYVKDENIAIHTTSDQDQQDILSERRIADIFQNIKCLNQGY